MSGWGLNKQTPSVIMLSTGSSADILATAPSNMPPSPPLHPDNPGPARRPEPDLPAPRGFHPRMLESASSLHRPARNSLTATIAQSGSAEPLREFDPLVGRRKPETPPRFAPQSLPDGP